MDAELGLAARQIVVCRLRPPLRHQLVTAVFAYRFRHDGLGIVYVAEEPRVRRTRKHTGWFAFRFRKRFVVDAIDAQRALAHHLALFVELPDTIGAGPRAVFAADALVVIDEHQTVFG